MLTDTQTVSYLAGSVATPSSGSYTAGIYVGTELIVDQSIDTTFAGFITDAGALTKTGSGTLTLTGGNS
jgi:hypothetical protein